MKNKTMTYVLGLLVVVIWGSIIYRVIKAMGDDDAPVNLPQRAPVKDAFNDYTVPKDTTRLILNYRDPFSAPKPKPVEIPINQLVHKPVIAPMQKPAVNWSMIKYSGYIYNAKSKKLFAMLNINNKEVMLSEGEAAEQVKLLKNNKDSVKVSYQGMSKFITLNTKQ